MRESRFKKGDRIYLGPYNRHIHTGGPGFVSSMKNYCNKTLTVSTHPGYNTGNDCWCFSIAEDHGRYTWTEDWFGENYFLEPELFEL